MHRGTTILIGVLLVATAFAGCLGGDDGGATQDGATDDEPERSLSITSRGTDSERARASVSEAAGDVAYEDLVVTVNGDLYEFGAEASYADATYSANGVRTGSTLASEGDVLQVPAAGTVTVAFRDQQTGTVWASYETTVPDETAPGSPELASPENGKSGVSRQPTFEWQAVADPSGLTYTLQVSLDQTFSQEAVVQEYQDLTSSQFEMRQDDELLPGQTYYWHVQATDAAGNAGAWSPTWSFTTGAE